MEEDRAHPGPAHKVNTNGALDSHSRVAPAAEGQGANSGEGNDDLLDMAEVTQANKAREEAVVAHPCPAPKVISLSLIHI